MVRTAFVSTYPPRHCGIATFTSNLARVIPDREVVVIQPAEPVAPYGLEVHHRIRRDERGDYARIAKNLETCADVVSVQHDFAIWGGEDGQWVLDFVEALRLPAVATLHTLPSEPSERQREIVVELLAAVRMAVVMSKSAGETLTKVYGIEATPHEVIPHGTPDLPLVAPDTIKPTMELKGRDVILSFGLVDPAKGYELMLEAMPAIVAKRPAACYMIVGTTHPDVLRREGEAYRTSLARRAKELELGDHVRFVDKFVDRVELTRWLQAADVFVTPYPEGHAVSASLAYGMAAGRAIVSTAYPYATELLADGRGVVVPHAKPKALAKEIIRLLADPERRIEMGTRAHEYGRPAVWTQVGATYRDLFQRVASGDPPSVPAAAPLLPNRA